MPKGKGRPNVKIGSKRNAPAPKPRKPASFGTTLGRVASRAATATAHRAAFSLPYEMGMAAKTANKALKKRELKLAGRTGKKTI